jgi:hypothetical protein
VKPQEESKPQEETPEAKAAREAEEAKTAANDTKKVPFKAEEIKFSSDDFVVAAPVAEEFVGIVNEHGLPRDVVAKLNGLQEKTMKAASDASSAHWNEMQTAWKNEVSADAEIGGTKTSAVLGSISKIMDEFGTPELRQALDVTGAGNNPHVIRFLAKVSKELGEGRPISGNPTSAPKTHAELLFPNQGKS